MTEYDNFGIISASLDKSISCGSETILINNYKKFTSFKSKENIHKKEVGPYHGFGY